MPDKHETGTATGFSASRDCHENIRQCQTLGTNILYIYIFMLVLGLVPAWYIPGTGHDLIWVPDLLDPFCRSFGRGNLCLQNPGTPPKTDSPKIVTSETSQGFIEFSCGIPPLGIWETFHPPKFSKTLGSLTLEDLCQKTVRWQILVGILRTIRSPHSNGTMAQCP